MIGDVGGLARYLRPSLPQFYIIILSLFCRIKVHAQDRPMSLWISSMKQLEPARHLINPILWDFMEAAWPSSISMVIPRGGGFE